MWNLKEPRTKDELTTEGSNTAGGKILTGDSYLFVLETD
jgi:hypothetical protein